MKKPKNLVKGSLVRIVSTARKISYDELIPSIKLFESWGLRVELGANTLSEYNQFAGTFDLRLKDLQGAIDDPNVDAIWCSRGGYGTTMLLDHLDFSHFKTHPKWVIGYSDVTSLLCHITTNLKIATLHATMPINIKPPKTEEQTLTTESLRKVLFGQSLTYELPDHALNSIGTCSGPLIGGNLSILYSILGSKSSPNTNGSILFIEDLDEYLYHIDRMLVNLKRNHVFDGLSGVIVGGMSDMNDNTIPFGQTAEEIIHSQLKDYSFPVYFGFNAGHVTPNLALPFGIPITIKNSTISIDF